MAREWNNVAVMRMLLIILIALCLAPMAQAQFTSAFSIPVSSAYHADSSTLIHAHIRNTSGATILAGTPVFEIGFTGGNLIVGIASASSPDSMPAIGLLAVDVGHNSNGVVIKFGVLTGIKTDSSGWSDGIPLYVDSGAHGLTHIKPTGANLVQRIGQIVDAGPGESGSFDIFGAGRSNDLPNFAQGPNYIWAGAETDSIPIEIDLDSAIAATALLQTDTAAYALTILNNPVMTLIAIADSFDIQGSVRIDGAGANDGRLGIGDVSDDYKIIMKGDGGATAFGFNTEASLHLISSYTSTFGYGADLSFGISSSVTPLNIIGGIRGLYTGLTADSGLGGELAFYTKNDGTSSTPELAMTIDQDKNVTIYGGINVAGNIVLGSGGGTITAGSGDEVITTSEGKLDGFALLANSVDDLAIDFGSGVNQVDLADIPGGIAPASAFDFGGATSLEVVNNANPTVNVAGEIAIDTDADGNYIDQGWITYYDGTRQMYVVAIDAIGTPSDNDVVAYNASADKWVVEAQTGAGGGGSDTALVLSEAIGGADIMWWSGDTLHVLQSGNADTLHISYDGTQWVIASGPGLTTTDSIDILGAFHANNRYIMCTSTSTFALSTTPVILPFQVTIRIDDMYHEFDTNDTLFIIEQAGWYEITWSVHIGDPSSTRNTVEGYVTEGLDWTPIPGSDIGGYTRISGNQSVAAGAPFIYNAIQNDTIAFWVSSDAATPSLRTGSHFYIKRID